MDVTEDPQRFEGASLVALFGAALLFVSPFLTWFDPGGSAWQLFELLDVVLIVLALLVGIAATRRLLDVGPADDPRAVPVAGGVAFLLVLATLLEPPPEALDAGTGFGAWLALFSSALIFGAGLLDLARVSVTVSLGSSKVDGTPSASPRDHVVVDPEPPASEAPPVWTAPPPTATAPRPRSGPASTDAPPSRSPSLLRPHDPPASGADHVPEGD